MAADIDRLIDAIRDDRVHGAAELGRRAAEVLIAGAGGPLEDVAERLIAAQPAMATIWNVCRIAVDAQSAGAAAVIAACREFVARMNAATAAIASHASELIQPGIAVLTHSASEAVFAALRCAHARGTEFRVIATESRPGGEGIEFAERLRLAGVQTKVVADAEMASAMEAAAIALIGADSINASAVVNKVGTRSLALAARHSGKPVFVLCPSMKLWDHAAPPPPLFEATPRELFSALITEEGRLRPAP